MFWYNSASNLKKWWNEAMLLLGHLFMCVWRADLHYQTCLLEAVIDLWPPFIESKKKLISREYLYNMSNYKFDPHFQVHVKRNCNALQYGLRRMWNSFEFCIFMVLTWNKVWKKVCIFINLISTFPLIYSYLGKVFWVVFVSFMF